MNPASLIPLAEPLPIHWAWFDILLIATLSVHLLFMNALLGSAAIGLVQAVRGNAETLRQAGKKLPPLLALTINMGVAPLLFLQVNYGNFDYVSSVLMGGWWLAVIFVLLAAYYGFYIGKFRFDAMGPGLRWLVFAASIAGCLYVGFMFTNNMTLMLHPETWPQYFQAHGALLNLGDATVIPRFLHAMIGALAVGGLFLALLGEARGNDGFVDLGMGWFVRATLVNLAVGFWFLIAQPDDIVAAFMGGNVPATGTLLASFAAMGAMLWAGYRKQPKQSAIWAAITVFLMVCTRHWLRVLSLTPWFDINSTPVTNQYGSFYLFLGFLVVGLALVGYMLKLYFAARGRGV